MPLSQERKAYFLIISAAVGWGCIGLFFSKLTSLAFSPIQVVAIRSGGSSLIFFLYLILRQPKALKIKLSDCKYFIGTGVLSFTLFNWFYFNTINLSTLPVAVVLLYTSPIFVLIMSVIFFKEKLSRKKMTAIGLTFAGCFLVAGALEGSAGSVSPLAIICGIASGFTFALYTICGRMALRKYSVITVIFYSFLFSFISTIPLANIPELFRLFNSSALINGGALVIFCTVLPFTLYTNGLRYIEASKAAVLATVEPIVASFLGVFALNEYISGSKIVGICLIILSIVILSLSDKPATGRLKKKKPSHSKKDY